MTTHRDLNLRVHVLVMRRRILSDDEMRGAWQRRATALDYEGDLASGYGRTFRVIPHPILGGEPSFEQEIPDYAGDARAAIRVALQFVANGWDVTIGNVRGESGWWFVGDHEEVTDSIIEVEAETFETATCLAAVQGAELLAKARESTLRCDLDRPAPTEEPHQS